MTHTSKNTQPILLCADDFALHPHIDKAVIQLAMLGRLSATSCMTTSPHWLQAAQSLQTLRPRLSIGLHFNLTEAHFGHHPARALSQIIRKTYTGQISASQMRSAWQCQLDAFELGMQTAPDFVDGHQHVHQLPAVRDAMLTELQARYHTHEMPWIRSTVPPAGLWRSPKAAIIALLGGWRTTHKLQKSSLPMNQGFGGVYGFNACSEASYGKHMARWLSHMRSGSLLMCHPAIEVIPEDAIGTQRPVEFSYLLSTQFDHLLSQYNCHIHQGPIQPILMSKVMSPSHPH